MKIIKKIPGSVTSPGKLKKTLSGVMNSGKLFRRHDIQHNDTQHE
jgi:hypothetical protein